mmetsp:Transcript_8227/g.22331  ORF Transcript_8227/g.22331 Transcript_8227/m.22331 type:complete len:257 (+) Transcript_8227:262-1032(+)
MTMEGRNGEIVLVPVSSFRTHYYFVANLSASSMGRDIAALYLIVDVASAVATSARLMPLHLFHRALLQLVSEIHEFWRGCIVRWLRGCRRLPLLKSCLEGIVCLAISIVASLLLGCILLLQFRIQCGHERIAGATSSAAQALRFGAVGDLADHSGTHAHSSRNSRGCLPSRNQVRRSADLIFLVHAFNDLRRLWHIHPFHPRSEFDLHIFDDAPEVLQVTAGQRRESHLASLAGLLLHAAAQVRWLGVDVEGCGDG